MVGLGEPREVRAGVVGGSYFDVMGLHPVLGRLLDMRDDGPQAAGAMVLTYRFWSTQLKSDPTVLGKTVRLGARTATVVGVLEPSVPYPAETEIIANVVTSPHHLSATMVTGRVHRMTELFGRLAPGADLEQARAELRTVYATMVKEHPEAYSRSADFRIDAVRLRDQITSRARTVLWVLLAASVLVFVIACSNVANLILARTVRREGELTIRAALGASTGALRRTLLAESLLLCLAGAALGVLSAQPMVRILARYASRFSVRALDLTVDSSMLWVGAVLAIVAAVLLAYVPRLPAADASHGLSLASGSVRITSSTSRRQRMFVVTQIAASFVLLAGASMLLKTLMALQAAQTGFDTRHVLAINLPEMAYGKTPDQITAFYQETVRQSFHAAGRGWSRGRQLGSVARCGQLRAWIRILRRRPCEGTWRGRSARAVSNGIAGILRGAGRADYRGSRFQCRGSKGKRAGGDREPERGAAHVPEWRCVEPSSAVDRSGHEVYRRYSRAAAHRGRSGRRG